MAYPVYTVTISVAVTSSSVANPSIITTATPHGFSTGASVTISGHTSVTPDINSTYTVTRINATSFSIPVNVTDGGVGGRATAVRSVRIETFEHAAQATGTGSFRCHLISADASYRPAKGQEIVAYEDANGLFGGIVQRVREVGLGGHGSAAIVNEVEAVSFDRLMTYRYVTETLPAGDTLEDAMDLLAPYLTPFGVAKDGAQVTGPTISGEVVWENVRLDEAVRQLSEITGYTSEIDYSKTWRMTSPASTAAPYDITTANRKAIGDIRVEDSEQDYANRILVKAGTSVVIEKTDTFTGDGVTDDFVLTYQSIGPLAMRGYITNGGVFETLGVGATWSYDTATNTLTRNSGAPTNLNSIIVRYDVQFPITVAVDDTAEQTARGYIVERVIEEPNIYDIATATVIGQAALDAAVGDARTAYYTTGEAGIIKPGQTQTITVAERDLSGTWTVSEVRTRNVAGNLVRRDVTAVEGTLPRTTVYRGVLRSWLGSGTQSSGSVAATTASTCGWTAHDSTNIWAHMDGADATVVARGVDGGTTYSGYPAAEAITVKNEGIYNQVLANTTAGSGKALTTQVFNDGTVYVIQLGSGTGGYNLQSGDDVNVSADNIKFDTATPFTDYVWVRGQLAAYALSVGQQTITSATHTIDASGSESGVFFCNPSASQTITLPDAGGASVSKGRWLVFKNISTSYTVTLDGDSTDTIDGALTRVLHPGEWVLITPFSSSAWHSLSSGPVVKTAVVTLTDAQIKALPAGATTLVAAPGSGYRIVLLDCAIQLDGVSGAYTNVNADGYWVLRFGSSDYSDYVANDSGAGHTFVTDLLTGADKNSVHLRPFLAKYDANWGAMPVVYGDYYDNTALTLFVDNNGAGNYTGGHANNNAVITVTYRIEAVA